MAFYGQKNYQDKLGNGPYTIAQIGCFLTAFCNLEQRFGKNVDPPSLNRLFEQRGVFLLDPGDGAGVRDDLAWSSVIAYDPSMHVVSTGGNSWPQSNNAIVKFDYVSPHNGQRTTHFCLVADHVNHTIVDSWDGVVKQPGYYGEPVAWAIYDEAMPQPVVAPAPAPTPPANVPAPSTATDGALYTFKPGDTVWSIAMRSNGAFTAQELMEHNGISAAQVRDIPVGYQIHLPVSQAPAMATSGIKYEVLNPAKQMHISKPGGADKWAFGNVKTWTDFVSNGTVAENTNVTIVGVATVIVGNETAAYYMDAQAFGDYAATGHVNNTIGYNWKDVADGFVEPPTPVEQPAPTPPAAPAVAEPAKPETPPAPPTPTPEEIKATFEALPQPELYIALAELKIKEIFDKRPDHLLHKNQGVRISGTVTVNGQEYGVPTAGIAKNYFFIIPMSELVSENELFNTQVDLKDKVALHSTLSTQEKMTVGFAKVLSFGVILSKMFGKGKK